MTTREIVGGIVDKVGYGPDAAKGMAHHIRANLRYQSKVVGRIKKQGERETAKWSLLG